MAFSQKKTQKLWILKAIDRRTRETIAWVTGGRNIATVRRLYAKLKHVRNATFYTDNWDAFSAVLPKNRHIIGKKHTTTIEQNNSNTRHYIGRFTRKTKIVSKSEQMVDLSMRLLSYLADAGGFETLQKQFLSIFI